MGLQYLNRLVGEGAATKLADNDASPSIGDKKLVIAPDVPPAKITAFDDVKNGHEWIIQPGAADLIIGYVAGLIETPNRVDFPLRTAATGGVSIDLYKENGVVRFRGAAGAARFTDAGTVADNAVIAIAAGQRKTLLARSYTGVEGLADGEFASLIPPATGDVTFTHAGSPATGQAFELDQDANVIIPGGSSSAFIVQRVGSTIRLSGGLSGGGSGEVDTLAALKLISVGTPRFEPGTVIRTKGRLAAGDGLGTEYVLLSSLTNTVFEERLAPLLTPRAAYAPDDYFLIQLASGFAAPRNLIERGVAHVRDAGGKADLSPGAFLVSGQWDGTDVAPAHNRIASFIRGRSYQADFADDLVYPVNVVEDDGGFYRVDSDIFYTEIRPVQNSIRLDLRGHYYAVGIQGGAVFDFSQSRMFVHGPYEIIGPQDGIGAFPDCGILLMRQSDAADINGLAGDCSNHIFNGTTARGWFTRGSIAAANSCEIVHFVNGKFFNFALNEEEPEAKTVSAIANNGSGKMRITASAHGLSGSDSFILYGTAKFNGEYTLGYSATLVDANTIDITAIDFETTSATGVFVRKRGSDTLGLTHHVDVNNEGNYASRWFAKAFTAVANQGGNARFTAASHGMSTGRKINIEAGAYATRGAVITVVDANTFDTTIPFTANATGTFYIQPALISYGQNEFIFDGCEFNNGSRGVAGRWNGILRAAGYRSACYIAQGDDAPTISLGAGTYYKFYGDVHTEVSTTSRYCLDTRLGNVDISGLDSETHTLHNANLFTRLRGSTPYSATIRGALNISSEAWSLRVAGGAARIAALGSQIDAQLDIKIGSSAASLFGDLTGFNSLRGEIYYAGNYSDFNQLKAPGSFSVRFFTADRAYPTFFSISTTPVVFSTNFDNIQLRLDGLKLLELPSQPTGVEGLLAISNGTWAGAAGLKLFRSGAWTSVGGGAVFDDTIFIPASTSWDGQAGAVFGNATLDGSPLKPLKVWSLPNSGTPSIVAIVRVPTSYVGKTMTGVEITYFSAGGGAGAYSVSTLLRDVAPGENADLLSRQKLDVAISQGAAPTTMLKATITFDAPSAILVADEVLIIEILRNSGHPNDTATDAMEIFGIAPVFSA